MTASSAELVSTIALTRVLLRRERTRITVWIGAITLMIWSSVSSVSNLFPTQTDLDAAASASDNPTVLALSGPGIALDTLGGQVVFQIGAAGLVIVGLMSVMITNRMTRKEEETGRLELVRSLPVGRHAPLTAAAIIGLLASTVLGVLSTIGFVLQGLPTSGSVIFGLEVTAVGVVFVGVAVVAAQITDISRLAGGIGGSVLALAFATRAIGDMGDGKLSWLSPIGWVQKSNAFGDERWWPFIVPAAASVGLLGVGLWLSIRRDLGAGLFPPRSGRARATSQLRTPLGLAFRLQRGLLFGWSIAIALSGAAYGLIVTAVEDFVRDNPAMADFMASAGGGSTTESYLATSTHSIALIASGFVVQSVLQISGEESSQRAELMLATSISRVRWAGSHLLIAMVGTVFVLGALGLSLGLSAAVASGDSSLTGRTFGAALAHAPALWLVASFGLLLIGFVPRLASAVWVLVVSGFTIAFFGAVLRLPSWVTTTSPFEHIPLLPVEPLLAAPLIALTAMTGLGSVAGLMALSRRDIG